MKYLKLNKFEEIILRKILNGKIWNERRYENNLDKELLYEGKYLNRERSWDSNESNIHNKLIFEEQYLIEERQIYFTTYLKDKIDEK